MFGGGRAPSVGGGGMQMPQAQLGQATMGGPAPQGMGFGLGQQMMQGNPGATQYAPQSGMAGMLSGMGAGLEGLDMEKLGPLMQMMQAQNQQGGQPQQLPMMPMPGGGGGGGGQGGQRDYLAQGGGIAPRRIVNKGY
jgi:hypothetical protein